MRKIKMSKMSDHVTRQGPSEKLTIQLKNNKTTLDNNWNNSLLVFTV